MPKELDEKVTIADLQFERQARDPDEFFVGQGGVETVVSEFDIIVSSTGSFNIINVECFSWKHRTL